MSRRTGPDLTERLRERILNLMHVWGLEPGDRLPGIRELAAETGVDHRAVARAYRSLEEEGLVEVRGRSGVYAAHGVRRGTDMPPESSAWIAEVLVEARRRRVSLPHLPELIRSSVASKRLRCAFVESTEDQLAAYTWELAEGYGLDVTPVHAGREDEEALHERLTGMDFAVTTRFHEREVRRVTRALGISCVIVAVDTDAARDVAGVLRERLQQGPLTLVVADRLFAERLRTMYDGIVPRLDQIRLVLADNRAEVAGLDPGDPVILTRAAQAKLGERAPPVYMLHAPVLSGSSMRDLCTTMVQLNTSSA